MRSSNYDPAKALENTPDPDPEITLAQKIIDIWKESKKGTALLNEWEEEFIASVHGRLASPTYVFSAKQRGTIFRLWKREIQDK